MMSKERVVIVGMGFVYVRALPMKQVQSTWYSQNSAIRT
jgi:hypothetical protein